MRSCSLRLCSGVVMETSSTLVNWCWRIMPRVSLPAAPASARKHGVHAVNRSGSSASSTIGFADQIGQRHLGGGDEPQAAVERARRQGVAGSQRQLRIGARLKRQLLDVLIDRLEVLDQVARGHELIVSELRQLRGAVHDLVLHQERRSDFDVAVLGRCAGRA